MLRVKSLLGAMVFVLGTALSAQAAALEFSLATELSGSGGTMSGPVVVTFDDSIGPNAVRLTIDLSAWDVNLTEYFSGLYLNYSGAEATGAWEAGFAATYNQGASSNGGNEFVGVQEGFNEFKADGQGFFDVQIDFNSAGNSRLNAGETAVFDITAAGLTLASLNVASVNGGNGEILIARTRSLGANGDDSGWFSGPGCQDGDPNCGGDSVVPEPSSMLMMGGGLLGLAWWRRRKNS